MPFFTFFCFGGMTGVSESPSSTLAISSNISAWRILILKTWMINTDNLAT